MKLDYKEFIEEINENVEAGALTPQDKIQVLRGEEPVYAEYCPIIDWYFDAFSMKEELETPLEEMYMKDEFSKEEWEELVESREEFLAQYKEDQPMLVEMTVKDVLTEMKQMQKLFK